MAFLPALLADAWQSVTCAFCFNEAYLTDLKTVKCKKSSYTTQQH